jgi:hypothetical protein
VDIHTMLVRYKSSTVLLKRRMTLLMSSVSLIALYQTLPTLVLLSSYPRKETSHVSSLRLMELTYFRFYRQLIGNVMR